jgi:hypothetical protein
MQINLNHINRINEISRAVIGDLRSLLKRKKAEGESGYASVVVPIFCWKVRMRDISGATQDYDAWFVLPKKVIGASSDGRPIRDIDCTPYVTGYGRNAGVPPEIVQAFATSREAPIVADVGVKSSVLGKPTLYVPEGLKDISRFLPSELEAAARESKTLRRVSYDKSETGKGFGLLNAYRAGHADERYTEILTRLKEQFAAIEYQKLARRARDTFARMSDSERETAVAEEADRINEEAREMNEELREQGQGLDDTELDDEEVPVA